MDTQKLMNITLPMVEGLRSYKAPVRAMALIANIALNIITVGIPIWVNWAHAIYEDSGFKRAFLPLYTAAEDKNFPVKAAAVITSIALDALVIPVIFTVLMSAAYALRKEDPEETTDSEPENLKFSEDPEELGENQFTYEGMIFGKYTTSVDPKIRVEEDIESEEVEKGSLDTTQALILEEVKIAESSDLTPCVELKCNVFEGGAQLDPLDYDEVALFSITTFTRDSTRIRQSHREVELTADQVIPRLNGSNQALTVLAPAFAEQLANQLIGSLNAHEGDYTFDLVDIKPKSRAFYDDQIRKMTRVRAEDVVILQDQFGQSHTYSLSYTWRANTGKLSVEFSK